MMNLTHKVAESYANGSANDIADDFLTTTIPFAVTLFFLIVATMISNSFVFFAVYSFRELRTVTNTFVISLACADVAVALLAMPAWFVSFVVYVPPHSAEVMDLGTRWIDIFCCSASIFNATLVSVDRYLAIIKPLRYKMVVTKPRAHTAIAVVWGLSMAVTAVSFIQYRDTTCVFIWAIFAFVAILCIPLCVMGFSYFCIYQAAIAQLTKMASLRLSTPLGRSNSMTKRVSNQARRKRFYQELRITKSLALVVSLFVIAWAPYLIMSMVETFDAHVVLPEPLEIIFLWLPHINSCVNPIVYTGMNKDFRKAFKRLLCDPSKTCVRCTRRRTDRQGSKSQSSFSVEDSLATMLFRRSRSNRGSMSVDHLRELQSTAI